MNIFSLARKNIAARPLQTLMSVLLFALSVGLITFLLLFNHQLKQSLDNNLADIDLVVGAKGSPLQLVLSSMYHVDNPTGNIPLQQAAPFLNPQHPLIAQATPLSLGDSHGAFRIVGTTPSILMKYGVTSIEGEVFQYDFDVVIGATVAKRLHLHTGDTFYSTHGLLDDPDLAHDHGSPFIVTGILPVTGTVLDQLILCTPQSIWKVHDHDEASHDTTSADSTHLHHEGEHQHADGEEGHAHDEHDHDHIHAHVHTHAPVVPMDTNQVKVLSDSIISALRSSPDKEITSLLVQFRNRTNIQSLNFLRNINVNTELMAASPALEINRLYSMLGNGTEALQYIAILFAIVAGISIFISLYTSLQERKYEMAILRIGGAGPSRLLQMILTEGFWISILGIAIGLLLGHVGMELAGNTLEKSYRYPFTGMIWIVEEYYVIIAGLLVGLLAALLPAIKGSRINLHDTLADR